MSPPVEIKRRLLPSQVKILNSQAGEILASGSWGSGKSRVVCEAALRAAYQYPGNRIGLFRKTAKALKATTLITLLKGDGKADPVIPPQYVARHHKTEHRIEFIWGSEIIYGGIEHDSENESWLKSLNLGMAVVDQAEELDLPDLLLLKGRLRHPAPDKRQLILACNPGHPGHFLYQRFFLNPTEERFVQTSNALENIFLPRDYLDSLMELTGDYYKRYVLGLWVAFGGLVYDNWRAEDSVSEDADYHPDHGYVEWAYDDGYASPRAILFLQRTKRGDIHIFDEHYQARQLEEAAIVDCLLKPKDKADFPDVDWADFNEAFKFLREGREEKGLYPWPDIAIGDPSAAELAGAFRKWDIVARGPSKCPVEESIKRVHGLIRDRNDYCTLKIHPRCLQLKKDMGEYVRKKKGVDANGEPVFLDRPEDPQPAEHTCDALRYWAWARAR